MESSMTDPSSQTLVSHPVQLQHEWVPAAMAGETHSARCGWCWQPPAHLTLRLSTLSCTQGSTKCQVPQQRITCTLRMRCTLH